MDLLVLREENGGGLLFCRAAGVIVLRFCRVLRVSTMPMIHTAGVLHYVVVTCLTHLALFLLLLVLPSPLLPGVCSRALPQFFKHRLGEAAFYSSLV